MGHDVQGPWDRLGVAETDHVTNGSQALPGPLGFNHKKQSQTRSHLVFMYRDCSKTRTLHVSTDFSNCFKCIKISCKRKSK